MQIQEQPIERMVLDVPVTCFQSLEHAASYAVQTIKRGEKTYCVAINPEKVCYAHGDIDFYHMVRKASFHICDGAGTAAAVRILWGHKIPRVTGVDLFFRMVMVAEKEDLGVYLLGADSETNTKAYDQLRRQYPRLRIVGQHDGYFHDTESTSVVEEINRSNADILFVALGSPKQERWMADYRPLLLTPFCMGVGGSFDVLSGRVKRAPRLFRKIGTEWLYRLMREPRRWKRQTALPRFAMDVLRQKVRPKEWIPVNSAEVWPR